MKIVGLKQALSDAEESWVEDKKFLAELEKGCATKEVKFDKVLKMIDDMVALLKQEQLDDDHTKEYCIGQFDLADDKKALERVRAEDKLTASIADAKETSATLADEIKTLCEHTRTWTKQLPKRFKTLWQCQFHATHEECKFLQGTCTFSS